MQKSASAAAIIWGNWQRLTRIDELPADCRSANRVQGYAVKAEVVRLSGQKAEDVRRRSPCRRYRDTGTCVAPVPVAPGDRVRADFGDFGDVTLNAGD